MSKLLLENFKNNNEISENTQVQKSKVFWLKKTNPAYDNIQTVVHSDELSLYYVPGVVHEDV